MENVKVTIGSTEFIFDHDIGEKVLNLENHWSTPAEGRVAYRADAAARALYPELGSKSHGVGTLVYFFAYGHLPTDDMVYLPLNGVSGDYRLINLKRVTRAEFARQVFGSERTLDGGITPTPGGRYRARAFITGVGQVAVGTYDTIEQARAARDEAVAHPERYPSKKKASVDAASKVTPAGPVTTSASVATSLDEAIAGVEAILAKLRRERASL